MRSLWKVLVALAILLPAGAYVLVLEGTTDAASPGAVPAGATARYPFRIERRD